MPTRSAFTLIEMLIVIIIIGILGSITLRLNRGRMDLIQSQTATQQRRDRQRYITNSLSTSGLYPGISGSMYHVDRYEIIYTHHTGSIQTRLYTGNTSTTPIVSDIDTFIPTIVFSGSLHIFKSPHTVGCTILSGNATLCLDTPKDRHIGCFTLDPSTCLRKKS